MGGLSIWHWIIVLVVVLLVFGTKRLRNAGKAGDRDGQVNDIASEDAGQEEQPGP